MPWCHFEGTKTALRCFRYCPPAMAIRIKTGCWRAQPWPSAPLLSHRSRDRRRAPAGTSSPGWSFFGQVPAPPSHLPPPFPVGTMSVMCEHNARKSRYKSLDRRTDSSKEQEVHSHQTFNWTRLKGFHLLPNNNVEIALCSGRNRTWTRVRVAHLWAARGNGEILLQFASRGTLTFGLLGQQAFCFVRTGVQQLRLGEQLVPVVFLCGRRMKLYSLNSEMSSSYYGYPGVPASESTDLLSGTGAWKLRRSSAEFWRSTPEAPPDSRTTIWRQTPPSINITLVCRFHALRKHVFKLVCVFFVLF